MRWNIRQAEWSIQRLIGGGDWLKSFEIARGTSEPLSSCAATIALCVCVSSRSCIVTASRARNVIVLVCIMCGFGLCGWWMQMLGRGRLTGESDNHSAESHPTCYWNCGCTIEHVGVGNVVFYSSSCLSLSSLSPHTHNTHTPPSSWPIPYDIWQLLLSC